MCPSQKAKMQRGGLHGRGSQAVEPVADGEKAIGLIQETNKKTDKKRDFRIRPHPWFIPCCSTRYNASPERPDIECFQAAIIHLSSSSSISLFNLCTSNILKNHWVCFEICKWRVPINSNENEHECYGKMSMKFCAAAIMNVSCMSSVLKVCL